MLIATNACRIYIATTLYRKEPVGARISDLPAKVVRQEAIVTSGRKARLLKVPQQHLHGSKPSTKPRA